MPRGANKQREREYDELVKEFRNEGRYRGREREVAARIVNKQRAQYGETRAARAKDRAGTSPDRGLPIRNYEGMTIDQVKRRLPKLDRRELKQVRTYEEKHKARKGLLTAMERVMGGGDGRTSSRSTSRRERGGSREQRSSRRTTSRGRGETRGRTSGRTPFRSADRGTSRTSRRGTPRTASSGGRRETRRGSGGGSSRRTTDHETIRRWVEERGGHPATIRRTASGDEAGVLRIDFPGYGREGGRDTALEAISWDEFFKKFDEEGLEFLYQDRTKAGRESRFFKFVNPSSARGGTRGRRETAGGRRR
ncbi:MAG TPA: hypothetical protein VFC53_05385 [Dehalococcoidia bacterium]|nr:hypothetical protein [Dehalococcoidia bacterium]